MALDSATNRDRDDGTMNEILNMDEAVDALTPIQVMDVWVRGKFARVILDARGPRYMHSEQFERVEKLLKDATPSVFNRLAIEQSERGRHSDLAQALGWEDGPGNVITLFDRWTINGHDAPVAATRENIKSALRGSGMARISIMRHRVQVHRDNPDELTMPDGESATENLS